MNTMSVINCSRVSLLIKDPNRGGVGHLVTKGVADHPILSAPGSGTWGNLLGIACDDSVM